MSGKVWSIKLLGGPFDGDSGEVDGGLPQNIWVEPCKACGTHWYRRAHRGCERYKRHEVEDPMATFIYCDLNMDPGPVMHREKKQPIPKERVREKEREKELVPA